MIRFILKGLTRDRSRSLFPVLMVAAGASLTVFIYSFMQGVMGDLLSSTAKFDTGHVKVVTRAYRELSDQQPNDLSIIGAGALLEELKKTQKDMVWVPRILFGGLLDIPDSEGVTRIQGSVMGLGIELLNQETPETNILNLKEAVVRGHFPRGSDEILISDEFARKLGLKIGDNATLIGSTMYGAMAMHNFKIAGTVIFGINAMDRGMIIVDLDDARRALDMPDGASEVLGFSKDMLYSDEKMMKLAGRFNREFSNKNDEFSPVMITLSQQNDFGEYLRFAGTAGSFLVLIFIVAMSIVLWNSGLMNGLRRYGEFGVRLALGESKGALYRWVIFEAVIIGLIGSFIGTLFGLAVSLYLERSGLDFGSMMQKSAILLPNIVRARVTSWSYVIGFFPGLLASVIGAMFAGIGIYKRQTAQLFKELEA